MRSYQKQLGISGILKCERGTDKTEMVLKCYSQIFIYGNKALPVHFEISDRQIVQSIK